MNKTELIAIIDLAWQDIKALEPEALGLISIVVGREGNEMVTDMGSTLPPEVVRYVVAKVSREWSRRDVSDFDVVSIRSRKAV